MEQAYGRVLAVSSAANKRAVANATDVTCVSSGIFRYYFGFVGYMSKAYKSAPILDTIWRTPTHSPHGDQLESSAYFDTTSG